MSQVFTHGEIIKSILRKRGISQEDLAAQLKVGRTRLNMVLNSHVIPEEYRTKILSVLDLPDDTLPYNTPDSQPSDAMSLVMNKLDELSAENKLILAGQKEILEQQARLLDLLQTRNK